MSDAVDMPHIAVMDVCKQQWTGRKKRWKPTTAFFRKEILL